MTSEGRRVGLAIFGVGKIGQMHLANVLKLRAGHLKYIVEEDLKHAKAVAAKLLVNSEVRIISPSEADQVYKDSSVEGIIICVPTNLHEDLVRRGLREGKAVFCEKPLALTTDRIEACYNDAEKYGKPLLCAFNRRFDPGVSLLRQRVIQGDVGEVHSIRRCNRDTPFPIPGFLKTSGGIFHDMGSHDIDVICWIIGEFPVSVFAQANAFYKDIADMNDVDQVMIVMKFPSGCMASIDMSRYAVYGYDQRLEVFGSKGMLEQHHKFPTSVVYHNEAGASMGSIESTLNSRFRESYEMELQHFLNVILGFDKDVLVKKEEAIQVCQIVSACQESYQTGKQIFITCNQSRAS